MNIYRDKIVYITGVGSGMGLTSARKLAAQGADIVGFDRSASEETRQTLRAACRNAQQRIQLYVADVSDRDATLRVLREAVTLCGAPDLVIHMAGIGGIAEMAGMPFEMFDHMVKINLYGTRHVVEALLPALSDKARSGTRPKLLLVGSMGGYVPVYGYTAYGTSKFGVVGFAKCLRYELKPRGIDVACFCPGEVMTPGLAAEREKTHPATLALKSIGGTITMDQATDTLLAQLQSRRFTIIPGWRTRLVHLALRLTPESLWNAITDALIARALRQHRA